MKKFLSYPLVKIILWITFILLFGTLNYKISQDIYPFWSGFFGLLSAICFLSFVYYILHFLYAKFFIKKN